MPVVCTRQCMETARRSFNAPGSEDRRWQVGWAGTEEGFAVCCRHRANVAAVGCRWLCIGHWACCPAGYLHGANRVLAGACRASACVALCVSPFDTCPCVASPQGLVLGSSLAGLVQHAAGEFVSAGENVAAGGSRPCLGWFAAALAGHGLLLLLGTNPYVHAAWQVGCQDLPTRLACVPSLLRMSPCLRPHSSSRSLILNAVLELVGHQDLRNGPPEERDHLVADALKQVGWCVRTCCSKVGGRQGLDSGRMIRVHATARV